MRGECANHKFVYNAPLQTERLVTDTADKHQRATQSYVRRPYGVGLLVAGYDATGPHLFQTCPSGNFYEWKAFALGSRSQSARTYLERNYDACSKSAWGVEGEGKDGGEGGGGKDACCCQRFARALPPSATYLACISSLIHCAATITPFHPSPPPPPVSRDELLREAAKALHTCLEPEKELTLSNCVFGVVGKGEAFTILEGDAAAPFIAGLGAAAVPGSHAAAAAAAAAAAPADAAGGDMGDAPQPDAPAAPGAMDIS